MVSVRHGPRHGSREQPVGVAEMKQWPLRRDALKRLAVIDQLLEQTYRTPELELGNKEDALDEAIYIILSFQTDIARARATWSRLRALYPVWETLERASEADVAATLREGGLHQQKARTIKLFL